MKKQSWSYRDTKAPSSPWGRVQDATTIKRGVRLVETAGHGGLMIAPGVAKKELSQAARDLALRYSGYYCYEEDCLCEVAFLEHPEWLEALFNGKKTVDQEEKDRIKTSVEYWYPQYFASNVADPQTS